MSRPNKRRAPSTDSTGQSATVSGGTTEQRAEPNARISAAVSPQVIGVFNPSPPIVLGTDFVRPRKGEGAYRSYLVETVALSQDVEQGASIVPVATIFTDKSWVMTKGDVPSGKGKGMVLFVELKAWTSAAAAATTP